MCYELWLENETSTQSSFFNAKYKCSFPKTTVQSRNFIKTPPPFKNFQFITTQFPGRKV